MITKNFIQTIYDVSDFPHLLPVLQILPFLVETLLSRYDQMIFPGLSFLEKKIQRLTFISAHFAKLHNGSIFSCEHKSA